MNLFGADPIPLHTIQDVEQSIPNIILWAAPAMFLFVLIEYLIAYSQSRKYYEKKETIGSILVGLGNVTIGVLIKTLLLYVFIVIYNLIPWRMEFYWWTFVPCYIIFDFCSYWAHNVSHRLRFFWATHVAHHSGEHYNLTVSFRLSWVQYIKMIFFLPVAFIGFHPIIIFITNQIAVLFQFWVHTEYIRKMPRFIEYIFATPSNHRVHHGCQEKYINKNYGATFIIWDRIFKTYQPEEEQAVYGITHNIDHKHDPVHINFHEYADMIRDVRTATSLREKLFFIFGNPSSIARFKAERNAVHAKGAKKRKAREDSLRSPSS
ncbi:sterol desaturase family protein [Fulvivirgaceae bacterium PWU4]|uniref:Sterol desaturase family protein n=1 Tax=Chryseosolibacter histidini TaxID=2782349 RepID=A0AAP2DJN7_9BACT|nr:sterol desaturase family protein [Chryseosolibacter histidini]MBT1697606.1 sterol desaturase family protein [Chryseosolibacter histidini]